MKIQPIVEGHGEIESVPILLRRLQTEAGAFEFEIGRPIRRPGSDLSHKERFQAGVQLAMQQDGCAALLILFDFEDGCTKTKAAELTAWATEVSGALPCAVELAYREFETWFLASLESLRGQAAIASTASTPLDVEARRDAKSALEELMPRSRAYSETIDQPKLTAVFDMAAAYRNSRSFRRMVSAFGAQVRALGGSLAEWPPATWQADEGA